MPLAVPGTVVTSGSGVGPGGEFGTQGLGINSFTTVTSFTVPPVGSTVNVAVADASWMVVGEYLWVDTAGGGTGQAGALQVTGKAGNTVTLLNPQPPSVYPPASPSSAGLMNATSGNTTDYVGGDNTCHDLAGAIQPTIWSMRLRSFNSVGNPNFEVDQRQVGNSGSISGGMIDRWVSIKTGMASATGTIQQLSVNLPDLCIPGTNFRISRAFLRVTLTAQQASLAAGDQLYLHQEIEGPNWRELSNDVHSVALLVRSSVAGLKFGLTLHDPVSIFQSLTKLCTITSANTWTLIQLPNIPVWPTSGNFQPSPGISGYRIEIALSAGSTFTSTANDVWQSGNFLGALGQSNFAASPVNSTFDIGFLQHEPGPLCTTLQDKPFAQNLDECLRYFYKTYSYPTAPGTATLTGGRGFLNSSSGFTNAFGQAAFPKPMAKVPSVTIYNHATGAAASVRDQASVDHTGAAALSVGDSGFYGISYTTANAGSYVVYAQYTADTGW